MGKPSAHGKGRELLGRALSRLFGDLSEEFLKENEGFFELVSLKGGERLFSQGDPGDSLYVVMSGRLRVLQQTEKEGTRVLAEIPRGESVGEMALITGEVRSAAVDAIRDSILIRLSRASFEKLVRSHPDLLLNLSRLAVSRLTRTMRGRGQNFRIRSVAVVFSGERLSRKDFLRKLTGALEAHGTVLHISRERAESLSGIRAGSDGSEGDRYLTSWLEGQEARHRFLVYETEAEDSPWTRRCIRQADRILVVAAASDDPAPRGIETALLESNGFPGKPVRELVLVHPGDGGSPAGTARWLVPRGSPQHHHVRLDREGDMERLARVLAGRAVGLVLSGGGAKAFAHIGALKALREASIPIDIVGGTSMGAVLAAGVAAGWDIDTYLETYRRVFSRGNPMGDYNLLPMVSFVKGERMGSLLRGHFGGDMEDLWIPCFCVSCNLTEASVETHVRGPLWKALRASGSLAGVLPPAVCGDDLHVDGGTLDNLPVTAARELGAGVVIACDLDMDKRYRLEYDAVPSNWELIKDRYITRGRRLKVPGLVSLVFQATFLGNRERRARALEDADLCFLSPVRKIRFLDWHAFDEAVEIGYRHARQRLEVAGRTWLAPNGTEG